MVPAVVKHMHPALLSAKRKDLVREAQAADGLILKDPV